MRIFRCECDNLLFFENTHCLRCDRPVRFCPACRNIVPILATSEPLVHRCGNPACGARLCLCANDVEHGVCNRGVVLAEAAAPPPAVRCDCCACNDTIPDLSVPGNLQKWYRLEAAKRRLFYDLDLLGLAYGPAAGLALRFDFKADLLPRGDLWRTMGRGERVFTGHADGKITINIREAEDAERERLRVDLGEAHRTLIGHFRHEIGHYYWQALIQGRPDREAAFAGVFGDPNDPPYGQALERYYEQGPPPDWSGRFVSAYAAMHPWEDWAETFALYLDMAASLDTAHQVGFARRPDDELDAMVRSFRDLGLAMNEMNRTMGLIDLVPELLVEPVVAKMRHVDAIVRAARADAATTHPAAGS